MAIKSKRLPKSTLKRLRDVGKEEEQRKQMSGGKSARLTIKQTTTKKPRRDARYHCSECPAGHSSSFDRLTDTKSKKSSQSFEKHVNTEHPDHEGEYRDLLGAITCVTRKAKD